MKIILQKQIKKLQTKQSNVCGSVIFIAPKADFPKDLIKLLEEKAEVYIYEKTPVNISEITPLWEKGSEKVLCPYPELFNWNFPNEVISKIPNLKAICLPTTSFDWIDKKICKDNHVYLTNVPNPPNGVAEGAIFMMLAVARKYPLILKNEFQMIPQHVLIDISGKTMGIIGLGKIGKRIGELGVSLGMKVIYWSRNPKQADFEYQKLGDVLKNSDFIFPCLAYNEETENFISKEKIDLMKKGASLISVAKRGVIDLDYLLNRVRLNRLSGVAFEDGEKKTTDFEGNVFVLPSFNWYTKETLKEKMRIWMDTIISVINNKPQNLIN